MCSYDIRNAWWGEAHFYEYRTLCIAAWEKLATPLSKRWWDEQADFHHSLVWIFGNGQNHNLGQMKGWS